MSDTKKTVRTTLVVLITIGAVFYFWAPLTDAVTDIQKIAQCTAQEGPGNDLAGCKDRIDLERKNINDCGATWCCKKVPYYSGSYGTWMMCEDEARRMEEITESAAAVSEQLEKVSERLNNSGNK